MSIITFSKQLTVGIKNWKDLDQVDPQLGFMTPFANDAAYAKRLDTLKGWCGGYYYPNTPPKTENLHNIDNTPMTRFQICNVLSRWSTSNKVFRLKDPRGFMLEIYTGNVEMIMNSSNILKGGFIEDACVWGRDGQNNVLVPITSEEYKESVLFAEKKCTVKDLTPGDLVQSKDGRIETYLGEFTACGKNVETTYNRNSWGSRSNSVRTVTPAKHEKVHAFLYKADHGNYQNIRLVKKPTSFAIVGKSEMKLNEFYVPDTGHYLGNIGNNYNNDIKIIIDKKYKVTNVSIGGCEKVIVNSELKDFEL